MSDHHHKETFITKYIFSTDHKMIAKQFLIEVMKELDIDISTNSSNHIDEYVDQEITLVLTWLAASIPNINLIDFTIEFNISSRQSYLVSSSTKYKIVNRRI